MNNRTLISLFLASTCASFILLTGILHAEGIGANRTLTMKYIGSMNIKIGDDKSFALSPDGKHIAFIGDKDDKYFVSWDGRHGRDYDHILDGSLIFSPDNSHLAYMAEQGHEWFIVIDGKEGFHHEKRGPLEQSNLKFIEPDMVSFFVIENQCLYESREKIQ